MVCDDGVMNRKEVENWRGVGGQLGRSTQQRLAVRLLFAARESCRNVG